MTNRQHPVLRLPSVRYLAVGAAVYVLGYATYLDLTALGLSPRTAVTVLLPVSLLAAFQGHARFTFGARDRDRRTATRYSAITLAGYLANLVLLTILVDRFGIAHQFAQLVAIAAIVPTMFVLLRRVVFVSV